jgi:uncharacterized protein (DUF1697 family)
MKYVALLRGINVGGNQLVSMSGLRDMFTKLGFADVGTLLQSGNVVFESGRRSSADLESLLEAETRQHLGVTVTFFVRSAAEWSGIVAKNPFTDEAERDPARLVVVLLKRAVGKTETAALQRAIVGREVARGAGREIYITYPDGQGRSKLTNAVIERTLGTSGTARNWNTVRKIAVLLSNEK